MRSLKVIEMLNGDLPDQRAVDFYCGWTIRNAGNYFNPEDKTINEILWRYDHLFRIVKEQGKELDLIKEGVMSINEHTAKQYRKNKAKRKSRDIGRMGKSD